MFVWLHTASPPQHIQSITETDFAAQFPRANLGAFLADVNARRGNVASVALLLENERGEVTIHLFDKAERADAFMTRNAAVYDVLIRAPD